MTPDQIREAFLAFFEEREHVRVPSASLVPENDPSLLFTGAGMNQFKDEFLGKGRRGLRRATSSQKCLRTGDLENVGRTAGHHSFFEMLGNFSFGDYFKREAIPWAWELLTRVYGLDPARLAVTVYREDDEAARIWVEDVGFPEDRLFRLGAKSNFWPANAPQDGPNGPCGPCSEIFFDYGAQPGCPDAARCDPACDCGRYIEVGNLVFTQFDRREGGELVALPQKNIDTGFGFERLVAVVEGVHATMDTSLFRPLLEAVCRAAGRAGYTREGEDGVRARRIADHVRAACFLVGDGVRPGNEGRGYVLRRLLRRAIRDGSGLGAREAFLASLVPAVADAMGGAYPELREGVDLLQGVLSAEEAQFRRTFESGMRRLEAAVEDLRGRKLDRLEGDVVFQLHDTYGFPVDMTAEILAEQALGFDRARFDELMGEQRDRARGARKMTENIFERGPLGALRERGVAETLFLGYGDPEAATEEERRGTRASGELVGIVLEERGELAERLDPGQTAALVFDRTPFYAESGGQIGDLGIVRFARGEFHVTDCVARGGYLLHEGRFEGDGAATLGERAELVVDAERRDAIRRNHTATHLLHRALKLVLGEQVQQAGSLVAPDRLRFDFTFDRALRAEELEAVERKVNEEVLRNAPLETQLLPVEEARRSAVALFGEKYPDPVRVVAVGDFSRELCGGTHCRAAGDIGSFRITSEQSIASGIRRLEAVTGTESVRRMQEDRQALAELSRRLGVPQAEIGARLEKLQGEVRNLRKRATAAAPALDLEGGDAVARDGLTVFVQLLDRPREELVGAAESFAKRPGEAAAVLAATIVEGKVTAVAAGNRAALERGFDAPGFLRAAGGRGGGKPHLAQGTFPEPPTAASLRAGAERALAGLPG